PPFRMRDWALQVGIVYVGTQHWNFAWWSLSVEVLFYLLVPALVPAMARLPPRVPLGVALIASSAAVALLLPWVAHATMSALPFEVGSLVYFATCFVA